MGERGFDYWEYFTAEARRNGAPLYECLASGVAHDEALKQFAATVQLGQPPANMLFGAVHYLLLRGAEHWLRSCYPNLAGPAHAPPGEAFPAFRDFVDRHRVALASILRARVTNTNEVGRSAVLHAGFREVARLAGAPLHIVELGPSAGLNLLWDSYCVRYLRNGEVVCSGASDGRLVLECEIRGGKLPPAGANPRVASRIGLERHPVDLAQADERDWLKALVWPDHRARFAALERALAIAADERLTIREGDALELLPDALAAIPADESLCVYHSFVAYQFSEEQRAALDHLLVAVSLRRALWRLSFEGTSSGDARLLLYSYRNGVREKRLLALCQPHGAWMDWRG